MFVLSFFYPKLELEKREKTRQVTTIYKKNQLSIFFIFEKYY